MTPEAIVALAGAATTVLGGAGMIIRDRRNGKLSAGDHQRLYIQDQQEDINALRRDLSQLWSWAMKTIRRAAEAGIDLDPLPAEPPQTRAQQESRVDKQD